MGIVTDYNLGRQLNHSHDVQYNAIYLMKAGDTATGTINLPATNAQGCNLVAAINASTCQIQAVRISIADAGGYYGSTNVEGALQEIGATLVPVLADTGYRRIMMMMGS
jgi:phage portal protein BeeE